MTNDLTDVLATLLLRVCSRILMLLPLRAALYAGALGGRALYFFRSKKGISYLNLKAAFEGRYPAAELRRMARRSFENFGKTIVEVLRFPAVDSKYIDRFVSVPEVRRVDQALSKGEGLIFLTAHFGNWEFLSPISCFYKYPLKVLVRDQKPRRVNEFLNELRTVHGALAIGKGAALREIIRALREGNIVGIVGDQGGGKDGVPVEFLGRVTTAPAGPIAIAQRTGAPVLPVFMVRENGGARHIVHVGREMEISQGEDPSEVRERLQEYYRLLEDFVRRYPDHFHWDHKRWKYTFTKTVLFLADGKAGHEAPLRAVAGIFEEIEKETAYRFRIRFAKVEYRSTFHRLCLAVLSFVLCPWIRSRLGWLRTFLKPESLDSFESLYTDFVVSCGSSVLAVHRLVARENKAKKIVLMKPPFPFSLTEYDLVIAPKHDEPVRGRETVLTEMMPNRVTPALLEKEASRFEKEFGLSGRDYVSVFIGGDTRDYRLSEPGIREALEKIIFFSEKRGKRVLVTTSRRTSRAVETAAKELCGADTRCPFLVIANEKNIENTAYGMLGLSRIAFVTEDSVAMISEAVSAGRKVFVLKAGEGKLPDKHYRFRANLEDRGCVRGILPGGIDENCLDPEDLEGKGAELLLEIRCGIKAKLLDMI